MTLLESLPTKSCNMRGRARIGSRRIARTYEHHILRNHELNFLALDGSMVISPGSKGGPRNVFSVFRVESESVLSLDFSHLAPTQLHSSKRILNHYSFIVNKKTWPMDNKIDRSAQDGNENQSKHDDINIGGPEGLSESASQQAISNPSREDRGSGSEEFSAGHHFTLLGVGISHV